MLSRRRFVILGGTALAGAAGAGLYAWQVEPHWVEIVREPMPLEHLSDHLVGKTLLQLSDIHVGPRVDSSYLIRELRRAQDLAPDFVAITGDFVSYRTAREYRELARLLAHLPRGRLATVAALGNHDYGFGWRELDVADQVASVVADAGAIVLRNQALMTRGLQFVGLGDLWSPEFGPFGERARGHMTHPGSDTAGDMTAGQAGGAHATLTRLAPNQPTIILAHNPDAQDLPIWDGVRAWVLAGHTHGGQVKPPFLPPPVLPVRNKRYTAGRFVVGPGRTLYINRGLGHLIQVRFNVRPEMTLFTLERAEHAV
jgi:predicted MPP superfamily phosphohydrolase